MLPTVNFVDKFKIFLEERYISGVIRKIPDSLAKNGNLFRKYFYSFVCRLLDINIENSMVNVILINMLNKFADIFYACRPKGVKLDLDLFNILNKVESLVSKVYNKEYVTLVKTSKNYKEMIWLSALNCYNAIIDAIFYLDSLTPDKAVSIIQ